MIMGKFYVQTNLKCPIYETTLLQVEGGACMLRRWPNVEECGFVSVSCRCPKDICRVL